MKTTVTDSCDNYLAKYGDSLKSKVIAHLRAKYPDSDIPASDYEILCSQDDVDETTVFQGDMLLTTGHRILLLNLSHQLLSTAALHRTRVKHRSVCMRLTTCSQSVHLV